MNNIWQFLVYVIDKHPFGSGFVAVILALGIGSFLENISKKNRK